MNLLYQRFFIGYWIKNGTGFLSGSSFFNYFFSFYFSLTHSYSIKFPHFAGAQGCIFFAALFTMINTPVCRDEAEWVSRFMRFCLHFFQEGPVFAGILFVMKTIMQTGRF